MEIVFLTVTDKDNGEPQEVASWMSVPAGPARRAAYLRCEVVRLEGQLAAETRKGERKRIEKALTSMRSRIAAYEEVTPST